MKGWWLQPSIDAVLDDIGVVQRYDCASPEEKNPQSLPGGRCDGVQLLLDSVWLSFCWPHLQERASGSLSCAFVVHGRLLSLQRLKTNRLPKPADQVPLKGCQHFCLWTEYHLAPRAIPQKRGPRSQSPAESPICRPSIRGCFERGTTGNEGTITFINSFIKI